MSVVWWAFVWAGVGTTTCFLHLLVFTEDRARTLWLSFLCWPPYLVRVLARVARAWWRAC